MSKGRGRAGGPLDLERRPEARMAAGEGVMLPATDAAVERFCGAIDPDDGTWPAAFAARRSRSFRNGPR